MKSPPIHHVSGFIRFSRLRGILTIFSGPTSWSVERRVHQPVSISLAMWDWAKPKLVILRVAARAGHWLRCFISV